MGHIGRFEELIAWQKARELTKTIYEIAPSAKFAKDFGLSAQIQRAAVSIMSNIADCALLSKNNASSYDFSCTHPSYLKDCVL
ncbi:MAG: four helix bundle protein [Chloroflexi bacterium]|nr:four helix bundle protein [Chloroflexota bacterium]MDL1885273.1 four helix bundle protein [Anaerolineae bacterium CFX8]